MLPLKLLKALGEVIFPSLCYICDSPSREILCENCRREMEDNFLINRKFYLNSRIYRLYVPFEYRGQVRELIEMFKYRKYWKISDFLASYITRILEDEYDCIVPVPLHPVKKKERGFNQSELIAKYIAFQLEIEVVKNGVKRVKNTKTQTKLSKKERERNVRGAFKIERKERFSGKRILLIDDVFTTGSTLKEFAKCFPGDVERIDAAVVAIARL